MFKKLFFICISFFVLLSSIYASEYYLGIGASAGRDYLTEESAKKLQGVSDYSSAQYLYCIGPDIEFRYYPFEAFRLGFHANAGVDFVTSINGSGYRSYRTDHVLNTGVGLSLMFYFGESLGIYTDVDFNYSWYRIAKSNEANIRPEAEFVRFQEYGIKGALGFVTRNVNWYFKFGFSYDYNLSSKPLGVVPIDLFVGGGYIF